MQFSEDDLRKALRRQDPGPAFTQRVMARVRQEQEAKAAASRQKTQRSPWLRWLTARPALTGAVATLALAIGLGLGYGEYRHVQQAKEAQRLAELKSGKEAEQKVMLALRITNVKLNQVFKQVNEPAAPENRQEQKIRRQSL
ncbi:MAG: anti-sigma factor [Acidobacteriia bacterium]|nr:anti-sigma factor [Terriglobia bacterium]